MENKIDFGRKQRPNKILNTKGCCFLCLALLEFKIEREDVEEDEKDGRRGKDAATLAKNSVSLRIVNRYLNINLEKLPKNHSSISKESCPSSSVLTEESDKKEEQDMHVALCQPCGKIVKKFSNLFLSLEKIRLEMDYWQERMHQQISNASRMPELVQHYSKRMTSDPETLIQLAFVDRYRKEISKMSLHKSTRGTEAKVKLVRLTRTQKNLAKMQTSTTFAPDQVLAPATATEESKVDHLLKFEEYDNDNAEDNGPTSPGSPPTPSSPVCFPSSPSSPHKKKNSNGNRNQTRTESRIKRVFNSKSGKFACTKCKKEFNRPDAARLHYDAIHLRRRKKCDICNISTFLYPQDLSKHKKTCRDTLQQRLSALKAKQNDATYKFSCPTCGKRFKHLNQMLMHNRTVHLKERNHACDLCGKTFITTSNLKMHKNAVHLGITLKCGTCSKEFKYKINHLRHERICEKKSAVTC